MTKEKKLIIEIILAIIIVVGALSFMTNKIEDNKIQKRVEGILEEENKTVTKLDSNIVNSQELIEKANSRYRIRRR
jgi:mannitol-1-phosphate/altronate dehydrogenase